MKPFYKNKFMHVEQLGDLYMYDVLLSYIYPRAFVCEDVYDSKYLFYEVSSKNDKDTWVVAKVSKKEYYALVDRKKAIQKAYEKKTGFSLFSITKTYGETEDIIDLAFDAEEWLKKLPTKPVYSEKKETTMELINWLDLLKRIPDFDLPTDTVGACELRIILASMPKVDILKHLDELEAQHPYKIQGKPETYCAYNEAWCDALDAVRAYVEGCLNG